MPSKNELGQLGVFSSMTLHTQHLNVGGISPQTWFCTMRFNVMSLQVFCAVAFFALAFLCNNLGNYFSAVMFAFASATIPFWMVSTPHFFAPRFCQAGYRTILSCTAPSFTHFELFSARFADTLQQSFWFARTQFLRTWFRTSMSSSSDMRVWTCKNFAARSARQCGMPAPFNNSLEFSHG